MNFISFIVPVYNLKEEELFFCISSIASQTVSKDCYEIIIVDDGSSNGIQTVCDSLGEEYGATVIHQPNQGLAVARNTGIKASRGDWIVHVDGDDWVDEELAAYLLQSVKDKVSDIVVWGYVIANGKNRQELLLKNKTAFDKDYKEIREDALCSILDYDTSFSALALNTSWGKAYRRGFLDNYQLHYNPSLRRAQDAVYNLNAFYYAGSISYVDKALSYYRNDNESLSRGYNPKTYDYIKLTATAVKTFVSEKDFSPRVKDAADIFIKRCFRMINVQDYQHRDNKKSYAERKRDFMKGFETEPFKSALASKIAKPGLINKLSDLLYRNKLFGCIFLFNSSMSFASRIKRLIRN